MALTREEQNELNRRAGMIGGMLRNPAWAELERALEEKIAKQHKLIDVLVRGPTDVDVDVRKIDRILGTIAGLHYVLGLPKNAEATLERYLREHGIEEDAA